MVEIRSVVATKPVRRSRLTREKGKDDRYFPISPTRRPKTSAEPVVFFPPPFYKRKTRTIDALSERLTLDSILGYAQPRFVSLSLILFFLTLTITILSVHAETKLRSRTPITR